MRIWRILGILIIALQTLPKQGDKPQPKQPEWTEKIVSPVVSNWPLIAVAIWGILVARRTLIAIERQAKANEDQLKEIQKSAEKTDEMIETGRLAAIATQRQAEYLVSSERPLLMIQATGYPIVSIKAVNKGKTTARIVFWNNVPTVRTPGTQENMGKPGYGVNYEDSRVEIINIPPIPPGGEMDIGSFNTDAVKKGAPDIWEEVRTLKRFLYIYSAIKYKGFLSDDVYESRWCFMVRSIGPLMAGDPGYNHYT
jgi:hypothetical protein